MGQTTFPEHSPSATGKPGLVQPPVSWVRRNPVAVFLIAIVVVLITTPFDEYFPDSDLLEALRLTVLLSFAFLAIGERRQSIILGLVLVIPSLTAKWLNHFHPNLVPAWTFLAPGFLLLTLLVVSMLRFILSAPRINSEVLCAGVATYFVLGLLWSFAYLLVASLIPDAFAFTTGPDATHTMKGFTAVYFSFITLTTVGYGDICPVAGPARMLAMMESTAGTFYMAVLVARLVSLHTSAPAVGNPTQNPPN